jgi:micrococcal nuclease
MNNLLEKYKLLNLKYKTLIWSSTFVITLFIFPAVIVFVVGLFLSYFLIKNKIWKYSMITIFCLATFISVISLIPTDNPVEVKVENNNKNIPVVQSEPVVNANVTKSIPVSTPTNSKAYDVIKVVDGDTIDVSINGKIERLRLIGINTPETVDPRKAVECFGVEASDKAKTVLTGKKVLLEGDATQGERDKYDRLLRYVFLEDGTNFNLLMIKEGYAYEYTYDTPYKYQTQFKQAQKEAEIAKAGLWGAKCDDPITAVITPVTTQNTSSTSCTIKGNINTSKEKIYHVIGCGSYNTTQIDESKGERWFCTEQDALDAGWRKAQNCN